MEDSVTRRPLRCCAVHGARFDMIGSFVSLITLRRLLRDVQVGLDLRL